jgi:hypothetical protein
MPEKERAERIAAALQDILVEREKLVVCKVAGRVVVTEADEGVSPSMSQSHPELFGHLLEIGEELARAGRALALPVFLVAVILCAAIQMKWHDRVFGIETEQLQGFWVYILIAMVAWWVHSMIVRVRVSMVYRRRRDELLAAIRQAGLSRRYVLAGIEGNANLLQLAKRLKLDRKADQAETLY